MPMPTPAEWETLTKPERSDAIRAEIEAGGGLCSQSDLARRWDVSRNRVGQMIAGGDFPEPDAEIGNRPAWLFATVDEWRRDRLDEYASRRR